MQYGDAVVIPGPLYHAAPFGFGYLAMAAGCHLVVTPRFDAEETLQLIERHRGAWLYVVPTMMHRIWALGEEAQSRRIARAIVEARREAPEDAGLITMGVQQPRSLRLEAAEQGADAPAEPLPAPVCHALQAFAQDNGGLVFEAKPYSAAVHDRDRPHVADDLAAFAADLAAQHGMGLKHGKMVIELTMPGSDKGTAVARFMELPPFAGTRPLFIGDDVTDEDAFAAVRDFDGGGILVGPIRPTHALWRLDSVADVHTWLENAA
jgi:hypothetical protein